MPRMNYELFQYIELKGSVTVDDVVNKFGISKRSVATMLSRYTNFKKEEVVKHYLVYEKGDESRLQKVVRKSRYGPKSRVRARGRYKIGPDWWGELRGAMGALRAMG